MEAQKIAIKLAEANQNYKFLNSRIKKGQKVQGVMTEAEILALEHIMLSNDDIKVELAKGSFPVYTKSPIANIFKIMHTGFCMMLEEKGIDYKSHLKQAMSELELKKAA